MRVLGTGIANARSRANFSAAAGDSRIQDRTSSLSPSANCHRRSISLGAVRLGTTLDPGAAAVTASSNRRAKRPSACATNSELALITRSVAGKIRIRTPGHRPDVPLIVHGDRGLANCIVPKGWPIISCRAVYCCPAILGVTEATMALKRIQLALLLSLATLGCLATGTSACKPTREATDPKSPSPAPTGPPDVTS